LGSPQSLPSVSPSKLVWVRFPSGEKTGFEKLVSAGDAHSMPERVLVIVPAFQEEASVATVVRQIRTLMNDAPSVFAPEVLVVDDGSTDNTAAQARLAGAIVASLPVNLGVGAALQTGFRYAVTRGYSTVVTIDADGQHPVSHIPLLMQARGALVVGSRFVPGSVAPEWVSSTRSAAMGVLRQRLTTRTGVRLYDPTSGFRVIREPLLTRFALDFPATYLGDTFEAHLSAAAVLGADQIAEVSVPMKARATGVPSSVGVRNLAYFARALLTTARPVWKPLGSSLGPMSSTAAVGSADAGGAVRTSNSLSTWDTQRTRSTTGTVGTTGTTNSAALDDLFRLGFDAEILGGHWDSASALRIGVPVGAGVTKGSRA
jgi:Glycosyl transferase family 2